MAPGKRVIITGATGLLGRAVVKEFERGSWSVQGWGFNRADGKLVILTDGDRGIYQCVGVVLFLYVVVFSFFLK